MTSNHYNQDIVTPCIVIAKVDYTDSNKLTIENYTKY